MAGFWDDPLGTIAHVGQKAANGLGQVFGGGSNGWPTPPSITTPMPGAGLGGVGSSWFGIEDAAQPSPPPPPAGLNGGYGNYGWTGGIGGLGTGTFAEDYFKPKYAGAVDFTGGGNVWNFGGGPMQKKATPDMLPPQPNTFAFGQHPTGIAGGNYYKGPITDTKGPTLPGWKQNSWG